MTFRPDHRSKQSRVLSARPTARNLATARTNVTRPAHDQRSHRLDWDKSAGDGSRVDTSTNRRKSRARQQPFCTLFYLKEDTREKKSNRNGSSLSATSRSNVVPSSSCRRRLVHPARVWILPVRDTVLARIVAVCTCAHVVYLSCVVRVKRATTGREVRDQTVDLLGIF